MNATPLPKSVRRIVLLERGPSGAYTPITLFERKGDGKKKGSRLLKPVEKAVRRIADAAETSAGNYTARHGKSNTKKRDGWLKDVNVNVMKSARKGAKRLKLSRLLMP